MSIIEERQKGGGGVSAGGGASASGGAAGGGGRGSSGTGGTTGGSTTGGSTTGGGTSGGGTKGGVTTGGGTTGGSRGGSPGSGSTGGGGGRGSSGSGGAMPGTGMGTGTGGAGSSPPSTSPRNIGPPSGINFGGEPKLVSAYGRGGGLTTVIRVGEPFAGRSQGGGTRNQIFGTRTYGSGYTDTSAARGVANRPFPFYFWPVVWGGAVVGGGVAYLDATDEYGDVNNSTRPGGSLSSAVFRSASSNSTFRIMSDGQTTGSLVSDLSNSCSSEFSTNPAPFSTPLDVSAKDPKPEEAIQYYRASSIVLTLDGYNNSATFGPEGTPETALPAGVDMTLLNCLNQTIGQAAPLVDAPPGPIVGFNAGTIPRTYSSFDIACLLFVLWTLIKSFK